MGRGCVVGGLAVSTPAGHMSRERAPCRRMCGGVTANCMHAYPWETLQTHPCHLPLGLPGACSRCIAGCVPHTEPWVVAHDPLSLRGCVRTTCLAGAARGGLRQHVAVILLLLHSHRKAGPRAGAMLGRQKRQWATGNYCGGVGPCDTCGPNGRHSEAVRTSRTVRA